MPQQPPKSEEEVRAMAEELIGTIEVARRELVDRLDVSAKKDAERGEATVKRLQELGASEQHVAAARRRAAGASRLREFTTTATKLKDSARDDTIIFTGHVDAPEKETKGLQIRFTNAAGKEVAKVSVQVGDNGQFLANVDVGKLGAGDVVATIVNAKGEALRESIPVRLTGGVVHLLDVLRKNKG